MVVLHLGDCSFGIVVSVGVPNMVCEWGVHCVGLPLVGPTAVPRVILTILPGGSCKNLELSWSVYEDAIFSSNLWLVVPTAR